MWERIEGNWDRFRQHARHEWARLTDEQLDEIDGRRDRLTRRVRDAYGVSDEEADKQIAAWEAEMRARGLEEREPAPRLDSDPNAYPPSSSAEATYGGTNAAAETRNEAPDPGRDARAEPRSGTPRTDEGPQVTLDNEGPEFGDHDRPGGAGLPSNQAGGRDGGGLDPGAEASGADSGARSPGNEDAIGAGRRQSDGRIPPGAGGRGSA